MIDSFDIPILLVSYNRPILTKKVFDQIRSITPKKLYFVSDGPKSKADAAIIDEIRDYVENNIDWQCDFKKLLRKNNLGCRYSVSDGINWFFENDHHRSLANNILNLLFLLTLKYPYLRQHILIFYNRLYFYIFFYIY